MATEFGRYSIDKLVGSGGMAEVHLARQVGYGGFVKPCVLKRISPRFGDDERVRQMFLEEARISALLNHPNIVQTFDFGDVDGLPYMAMELVNGVNLLAWMKGRSTAGERVPLRSAVELMAVVLDALGYAHELADLDGKPLHVVHRDVSPQNILVSREGAVKLADFGIARHDARDQHTQGTVTKGKPGYMAPEGSLGDAIDGRADVYAAGVVLVELISLAKFHSNDTPFGGLAGVKRRVDERLDAREDVPQALRDFIHRLTAIDPGDRPDAKRAADELRRVAADLPKSPPLVEYLRQTVATAAEREQQLAEHAPTPPPAAPKGPSPRKEGSGLDERGWPTAFGFDDRQKKEAPPPAPLRPLSLGRSKDSSESAPPQKPQEVPAPTSTTAASEANRAPRIHPAMSAKSPDVPRGPKPTPLDLTAADIGQPMTPAQRMLAREREARQTLIRRVFIVLALGLAATFGPKLLERPPEPKPTSGSLTVRTEPPGAEVRVNDLLHLQRTPTTIPELPLGVELEVRVAKVGYVPRPTRTVIAISQDTGEAAVDFDLEPSTRFEITTIPPGAQVKLGGDLLRSPTPVGFDLAVGRTATITVTAEGRLPVRIPLHAAKPGLEAVSLTLDPAIRVELSSEPSNAYVRLDGVHIGRTPMDLDVPLTRVSVLSVEYPGHQKEKRTFDPKRPPPKKLAITLKAVPFQSLPLLPSERKQLADLSRAHETARRDRADLKLRIAATESKLAKFDFSTPMEVQARVEETLERMRAQAVELEGEEEEAREALAALRKDIIARIESTAR
ncbi:MAG: serine/threonine protein kinase [Deltaproteobacteria bacterium]|nr:serine/threonine protein kinase [Deltaproteobacteria bacterium]